MQNGVLAEPSRFIIGPWADRVFFIFSPLLALALGGVLSATAFAREDFMLYGKSESWISVFSGMFTASHLVIVFFRSHGNSEIFKTHPTRFVVAPVLVFAAMALSSWMLIFGFVLAVWWDVYHSSLQTFGLGRAYDAKAGKLSDEGRALDRGLNLLLYMGPILGGAALMDHVGHFDKFASVGSAFFTAVPVFASKWHRALTALVLAGGTAYLAYYAWRWRALARAGHAVSEEKILLYASTGLCSLYAWGFNAFGQAFFIMNFFHALQYFALVAHTEKKRAPFALIFAVGAAYGVWAKLWSESSHAAFALFLTVSLMHFWFDGFIWSVRKKQIS